MHSLEPVRDIKFAEIARKRPRASEFTSGPRRNDFHCPPKQCGVNREARHYQVVKSYIIKRAIKIFFFFYFILFQNNSFERKRRSMAE